MHPTKINVAVVDDDESFARAIGRLLRASGFEVSTYLSAEAFLATTTRPEPECLVLDIQLGGMSGLDLQRRLHELGVPVPIIFVTAHDGPAVRQEAQQAGCSAYFLKPVRGESLLKAIAEAVNPSRSGSQNPAAN
ncbi:MAG: response regulator [Verrucomicrobia bacterium]|nr:response regulator [Verrucomicrobiota bacterium]